VRVLEALLPLLHPIMPYITEELWQKGALLAGHAGDTIMLARWPQAQAERIDRDAVAEIEWLQQVVLELRRIRSEMDLNPGQRIPLRAAGNATEAAALQRHYAALALLARVDSVATDADEAEAQQSATALVGELKLFVPLSGLIDRDAELERLDRQLSKLEGELERAENKLANEDFVAKAPTTVVDRERNKRDELQSSLVELRQQRERIAQL